MVPPDSSAIWQPPDSVRNRLFFFLDIRNRLLGTLEILSSGVRERERK
jgi:hypothetical protein